MVRKFIFITIAAALCLVGSGSAAPAPNPDGYKEKYPPTKANKPQREKIFTNIGLIDNSSVKDSTFASNKAGTTDKTGYIRQHASVEKYWKRDGKPEEKKQKPKERKKPKEEKHRPQKEINIGLIDNSYVKDSTFAENKAGTTDKTDYIRQSASVVKYWKRASQPKGEEHNPNEELNIGLIDNSSVKGSTFAENKLGATGETGDVSQSASVENHHYWPQGHRDCNPKKQKPAPKKESPPPKKESPPPKKESPPPKEEEHNPNEELNIGLIDNSSVKDSTFASNKLGTTGKTDHIYQYASVDY